MSVWLCVLAAVMGQVELRRGEAELPAGAVVTAVSIDGVTLSAPGEAGGVRTLVLGWQSVRAVKGEFEDEARAYSELADKAWRASSRLQRGDVVMAEPVLDELFPRLAGRSGPTALMVCDGLLRCRLRRGAQVGAIEAWLAGVSARAGLAGSMGNGSGPGGDLGALLDARTGLTPALPPVWIGAAGVQVWALAAPRFESAGGAAAELEVLYRQAARFECGLAVTLPGEAPENDGVRLVWEMVQARAGEAEARRAARQALAQRFLQSPGTWQEAWCRAGLGRSMLRETSVETRRLGIVELLHLPARLADQSPYLTGIALAEAAAEVRREGDDEAAWRLRSELIAKYPDHPALQWEALRGWAAPAKAAGEARRGAGERKQSEEVGGPDGEGPGGGQ
ncbi:MAG: hypothetical protein IT436_06940 [Phycisphaerales bacterium]|nr:hypothetical protein [Phycisphaerales bacterium]